MGRSVAGHGHDEDDIIIAYHDATLRQLDLEVSAGGRGGEGGGQSGAYTSCAARTGWISGWLTQLAVALRRLCNHVPTVRHSRRTSGSTMR